jgi:hypothetical protein
MIREIVDSKDFDKCLEMVEKALESRVHDLEQGSAAAAATAESYGLAPADLRDALAAIRELRRKGLPGANARDAAWMPRDPMASILQSAIEEFYREAEAVDETQARGLAGQDVAITDRSLKAEWQPADPQGFARAFESTDPRWVVSFLAAKALAKTRGQHAFPTAPPPAIPMASRARVLLVGDWGSGVQRAQKVAARMRQELEAGADRERHVIHLGDVYYSGFESEYRNRFLPFWPVKDGEAAAIGSYCLNANHDMFTGGHAYFDFLLAQPRFARQGGSSYFSLENAHWQILGLDTGYDPQDFRGEKGSLFGAQANWVQQKRAAAPSKKAVLLSHHQLFSAWEGGSPELERKLQPVLSQPNGVTAWFWAHEHRCAIYDQNHPVRHARLAGHGGVPVYGEKNDTPAGVTHEFRDSFRQGLERFARFGFAVLDFEDGSIAARYVTEDGVTHFSEVIR